MNPKRIQTAIGNLRKASIRLFVAMGFLSALVIAKDQPNSIRQALMQAQTALSQGNALGASIALKKASQEIFVASIQAKQDDHNYQIAYDSLIWLSLNGQLRMREWTAYHSPSQAMIRQAGSPQSDLTESAMRLWVNPKVGEILLSETPYNLRSVSFEIPKKFFSQFDASLKLPPVRPIDYDFTEVTLTKQDQAIQEYLALITLAKSKASWTFPRLVQWSALNTQVTNRWALARMGQSPGLDTKLSCSPQLFSFSGHQVYTELLNADQYEDWNSDSVQDRIRKAVTSFRPFSAADFSKAFESSIQGFPESRIFFFFMNTQEKIRYIDQVGQVIYDHLEQQIGADPDPYSVEILSSVLPGDRLDADLIPGRILRKIANRQIELAWPLMNALSGQGIDGIQGIGITRLDRVEAKFKDQLSSSLSDGRQTFSNIQEELKSIVRWVQSKTFQDQRKQVRLKNKIDEVFSNVSKAGKLIYAYRALRPDEDGEIDFSDQLVAENLRTLVQIENPAEFKEYWNAAIKDPSLEGFHSSFYSDHRVVPLVENFFVQLSEKWAALKPQEATPEKLESLAHQAAVTMIEQAKKIDLEQNPAVPEKSIREKIIDQARIQPMDKTYVYRPKILTVAEKVSAVFYRMNLPLGVQQKWKSRKPRLIETRGQFWTLLQLRMGRLLASSPVLNHETLIKLADDVVLPGSFKLDAAKTKDLIQRRFKSAAIDDQGKLESFCRADLRNPKDENFRKLFLATAATRQSLSDIIEGFSDWNQKMVQATKTRLERFTDRMATAFLVVGAIAISLAVIVYSAGAMSATVPAIIATALSLTTQVMLPMTVANIYVTMKLNFIEKPAQLAFQEAVASARIFGDTPEARGYLAQRSLDAADPVSKAMVGKIIDREVLRKVRSKMAFDQPLTLVFALMDMVWLGATIRTAVGQAANASMKRLAVKSVLPKESLSAVVKSPNQLESGVVLKKLQQSVKQALVQQKQGIKNGASLTVEIFSDMVTGRALKWFRPIIQSGQLSVSLALKAGEAIGDDLVRFSSGIDEFIQTQKKRLDSNGRLLGSLTSHELSKHAEVTWYGIGLRTLTGQIDQPLQSGLHWVGLTPISELKALKSGQAVSWYERFGSARNDLLKLRGQAIQKSVIEPAESLSRKAKAVQELSVAEYVESMKRAGLSSAEVKVMESVKTKGQVLMASLTHEERDVLKRIVDGESFYQRAFGIYKIKRSLGLREIGKLSPILKDYEQLFPYAKSGLIASGHPYEPATYIEEIEAGLKGSRENRDDFMDVEKVRQDFQNQYDVIRQFELGSIELNQESKVILDRLLNEGWIK